MAKIQRKIVGNALLACILMSALSAALAPALAAETPNGWEGRALLTGTPVSARHIPKDSGPSGRIVIAETYRVSLKEVEAIYGNFDRKRISLDLTAAQPSAITGNRRIFVLVEVSPDGSLRTLSWGVPLSIICLDEAVVETAEVEDTFHRFEMLPEKRCTNAEWFR